MERKIDTKKFCFKITKKNEIKLKWFENKDEVINKALDLYFSKDFCVKEIERNVLLWYEWDILK